MKTLTIFDTTLRDGTQGEGISLSVDDKLKIVKKLDEFGIDYIEGGWPGSNPKDEEFFRRVKDLELRNSEVVAFSCTKRHGIDIKDDLNIQKLVSSGVRTLVIFAKSWDFHVTDALEVSLEDNIQMIKDTVSYLKDAGFQVFFDAEHFFDGYINNKDYALETLKAARENGADLLILCDTNGGLLPGRVSNIFREVKAELGGPLGIHAHNDSGVAVANSLAAFEEGAVQIQGTIGGLGERCGNVDLCSIIPALLNKYGVKLPKIKAEQLTSLYYYVMEIANLVPDNRRPYVGRSAFAHKGGIHVSALQKNPHTYEHVSPDIFGNKRRVLISELAGKSNFQYKLKELGFPLEEFDQSKLRKLSNIIKEMEYQGYQFEGAEASLKLLIYREYEDYTAFFKVDDFKIISHNFGKETSSEVVIKVTVSNGEKVHTAAEGDGPVNALDNALRKALNGFSPYINQLKLIDYKVRVLNGNDGTAARVRVLIETSDGERTWTTVGVSTNIIQASWKALTDSIEYGLMINQEGPNNVI
jgi:2-isopropylmalate synthase